MRSVTIRFVRVFAAMFLVGLACPRPSFAQLPMPNQPILVVRDSTSSDPGRTGVSGDPHVTLFSESFVAPDQAPLNPANWELTLEPGVGYLQVLDDQCTGQASTFGGEELVKSVAFAGDQYAQFTLGPLAYNVGIDLRTDLIRGLPGYSLDLFSNGDGTAVVSILLFDTTYPDGLTLSALPNVPVRPGDVFRFEAFGSTLTALQNGNVLMTATDGTWTEGLVGLYVFIDTTPNDTSVTHFEAGNLRFDARGGKIYDRPRLHRLPNWLSQERVPAAGALESGSGQPAIHEGDGK